MTRWLPGVARTTNFSVDGDRYSVRKLQCRLAEPLQPRTALLLCVWAASLASYCCGLFVGWSSHATTTTLPLKVSAMPCDYDERCGCFVGGYLAG